MALTTTDFKRPTEVRLVAADKRRTPYGVNGINCLWEVTFEDGEKVRLTITLEPGGLKDLAASEENPKPDGVKLLDACEAELRDHDDRVLSAMLAKVPNLAKLKRGVAMTAFGLRKPVEEA